VRHKHAVAFELEVRAGVRSGIQPCSGNTRASTGTRRMMSMDMSLKNKILNHINRSGKTALLN
jgi:hypothetical protein